MKPSLKAIFVAGGIAVALLTSSRPLRKWNLPTRSNERNYHTRNILQFAADVKKSTNGKVDIIVHPRMR